MSSTRVCMVAGVGPRTGAALSRRFAAGGSRVAMLARDGAELGTPAVLIHNAGAGHVGRFMDVTPETLEPTFRTNVLSLMHLGQALVPPMRDAGGGAIVVTGNTSAWRGSAGCAAFAPSKAAQRILAQSMARSLGPDGIHVAHQDRSAWTFEVDLRPFGETW